YQHADAAELKGSGREGEVCQAGDLHGAAFCGHYEAGSGDDAADARFSLYTKKQIPQPRTGGAARHGLRLRPFAARLVFRPVIALMAYSCAHTSLLIHL